MQTSSNRPPTAAALLQARFAALLGRNLDAAERASIPRLDGALARRLLERLDALRLFAHAYTHLANFTHGSFSPRDLLHFAWRHELDGVCIHLLDGEERSIGRMDDAALRAFGAEAARLGLAVHLETSSTERAEVDRIVHACRLTGAPRFRVYARHEGPLSTVLARVREELDYIVGQAEQHDLHVDFEQHEELKSSEIVALIRATGSPRLGALFDFGNMINAAERPLDALRTLVPHIRQAHLKGVKILPQGGGWGHRGVLQGSADDELPAARLLFELLLLGDDAPQVVAFALEQENHYEAPMFRHHEETADPFIPWRAPSETPLPAGMSLGDLLESEPRWAGNQLRVVRGMLQELRWLAELALEAGT